MADELSKLPDGCVVAFVHAKRQSDRLPGKNLRILGDKPLFCHAIATALRADRFHAVVIDSEDDAILQFGKDHGAIPLQRPSSLATNDTTGDDLAVWQCNNVPQASCVVQVVPTSPFIKPASVWGAVEKLQSSVEIRSVAGCREQALYTWREGFLPDYRRSGRLPNSNELDLTLYETTGLYVMNPRTVLHSGRRVDLNWPAPYLLSPVESIDINNEADWELAELVWRGLHA